MITVGIRQLKEHASQLVRQVRESGSPLQISYHGKVVALLIPVEPALEPGEEGRAWAALDELAAQIGHSWPHELSIQQAIQEERG